MERQRNKVENYSELNTSFPNKLYALMLIEEGNAVEWCNHGFAFKITDQNYFLRHTIPKYFRHTKLTSFQRQLNLYGFRRVLKGDDEGAYFHPKFQRGRKELIPDIQRLPAKQSLVSLQEIMNSSQQSSSVQGSFSSKKKKTAHGSPKLRRKARARAGSVSSSSEEPEEPEQQEAVKQREIPINYFMNSGRPKRQVQVAAESAHNNALQARHSNSRARGAHRNNHPNPLPQSSNGASAAKDTSARHQAAQTQPAMQAHSPLSSIHSTSTDGESSGGDHHQQYPKRHRHHHRHPRAAHKDLQDPITPVNRSFGSSSSTHVPHLKMPSYDETHDDILDLSLTSPLFGNEMMMDAPSTARMYSPTALAKATAQAGFDSASAVDCQHTTDFAGLGSTQQDLSWSSNYYSLGALGRLPLITDYSPKVTSNPCLTISGSSASASAQSAAPKHISYIPQQAYQPMMRSAQSVPTLLHAQYAPHGPQNTLHMQHAHSGPKLTFGAGTVTGAVMTNSVAGTGGGSAGAVLGVGEPSGIWLGDPLDDLLDFFEPSPEATMSGCEVGCASSALPAFPASGFSRSGGAATEAGEGAAGSDVSAAPVGMAPAGINGGVHGTGSITG